jgi:hypothetical protein
MFLDEIKVDVLHIPAGFRNSVLLHVSCSGISESGCSYVTVFLDRSLYLLIYLQL